MYRKRAWQCYPSFVHKLDQQQKCSNLGCAPRPSIRFDCKWPACDGHLSSECTTWTKDPLSIADHAVLTALKQLHRYKHILGWPLTVADLEQLDADTYANLCKLKDLDDVEVQTAFGLRLKPIRRFAASTLPSQRITGA